MFRTTLVASALVLAAAGSAAADLLGEVAPWAGSADTDARTAAGQAVNALPVKCSNAGTTVRCESAQAGAGAGATGSPTVASCAAASPPKPSTSAYFGEYGAGATEIAYVGCGVTASVDVDKYGRIPLVGGFGEGAIRHDAEISAGPAPALIASAQQALRLWTDWVPVDPWDVGPPAP